MTRSHTRWFASRCQVILALTLLFAFVPFSHTAAQVVPQGPLLTIEAAPSLNIPGSILVSGSGFTAGGDVFIGLYDQWGKQLYEPRWAVASSSTYGYANVDLPVGYMPGGEISELFDIDCRSGVMIRAYDRASGIWTDVLDVDVYTSDCVPPRDDTRRTPD